MDRPEGTTRLPAHRRPMPDPVEMLKQDHARVKGLFRKWEAAPAGQPERRRELVVQIIRELVVHERIEEDVFYPAFRQAAGAKGKEIVAHSHMEHEVVDNLVDQLQQTDLDDPQFEGLLRLVIENVEHHIQEEEEKMLPKAHDVLGADRLEELAGAMMELKEGLIDQTLAAKPAARAKNKGR